MNKLLFITLLITIKSFTQVTVSYSDFASIGDVIVESYNRFPNSQHIKAGDAGPNKVWDFSSLETNGKDSLCFVDPQKTPFAKEFPKSNIALLSKGAYNAWIFMNNTPSELINNGYGIFIGDKKTVDVTNQTFIKYPLQYKDTASNNWLKSSITLKGKDSIKITRAWELKTHIDAWGDIILPTGTFFSLRLKAITSVTQSYYKKENEKWVLFNQLDKNTSICYRWYTHDEGIKYPLAQMVMDQNNEVPIVVKFLPASPFEETVNQTKTNIHVYPNPATDYTYVHTKEEKTYISLYSLNGQLIKNIKSHENKNKIDLKTMADGIYFVVVRNVFGKVIGKNKIIKKR